MLTQCTCLKLSWCNCTGALAGAVSPLWWRLVRPIGDGKPLNCQALNWCFYVRPIGRPPYSELQGTELLVTEQVVGISTDYWSVTLAMDGAFGTTLSMSVDDKNGDTTDDDNSDPWPWPCMVGSVHLCQAAQWVLKTRMPTGSSG